MIRTMTTMFSLNSTTISTSTRTFTTVCGGYIDVNGIWNNGFICPMQEFVQYICCGTDYYHYCCPSNHSTSEIHSSDDPIYLSGQYQPSDHVTIDRNSRSSLINHSNVVQKQFEQFQKLFLPIFLLTSSILFLVGIAIWFWLYKHKAFYAAEHDDVEERNPVGRRTIPPVHSDPLPKRRENVTFKLPEQTRRMSYPSTEV